MKLYEEKKGENKQQSVSSESVNKPGQSSPSLHLEDNRSKTIEQKQLWAKTDEHFIQSKQSLQKKKNKTGLPEKLKTGIENLSGYTMDDVKVHYNSNKPKQIQAHAYAQGTDIHLATGQEKHLPHEAWHVIQQKQGRVKSTRQMKGNVHVNDNEGLEREADVMGEKALSSISDPLKHKELRAISMISASSQKKVVQRITTQIVMKKGKIVIVIVRGRPPRTFANSMGDHTTAFIVHTEGINIAMQGMRMEQAVAYLNELNGALDTLPGVQFMRHKKSDQGIAKRFDQERTKLNENIALARLYLVGGDEVVVNNNLALNHIQLAVNNYLDARELVPLSTVNVAARSQGKAGKGHGESSAAAILSTFERNPKCGIDDVTLTRAVFNLFDDQSATMLAAETKPHIAFSMTAGVTFGDVADPNLKLQSIWDQHRRSIAEKFPLVYKRIAKNLKVKDLFKNLKYTQKLNLLDLLHRTKISIDHLGKDCRIFIVNGYTKSLSFNKLKAISELYQKMREIKDNFSELNHLNAQLKGKFEGNIVILEEYLHQISQVINKNIPRYEPIVNKSEIKKKTKEATINLHDDQETLDPKKEKLALERIGHINDFRKGSPLKDFKPRKTKVLPISIDDSFHSESLESDIEKSSVITSTVSSQMNSMSIQLILNRDGTIKKMLSSGRPPSPFNGTMGAHTTSWIVHLDRVRKMIVGESLVSAGINLKRLLEEVEKMATDLVKKKSDLGSNAKNVYEHSLGTMRLFKSLNPTKATIVSLQSMINAILSLYNLLPGVSVDKIDTTGHGEGTYRKQILLYEHYGQGTREQIIAALNGLFDGSKSSNMYKLHLKFLKQAYPKAFEFAKTGVRTAMEIDVPESEDINSDTELDETQTELNPKQISDLEAKVDDSSWLVHVNNCLINAITDGAHIGRATGEQVITIRKALGVPLGEMLFASQRNLNIILHYLGLANRGVIVFYINDDYPDRSSNVSDDPIYVEHDGRNHFTAMFNQQVQGFFKKREASKRESKQSSKKSRKKTASKKRDEREGKELINKQDKLKRKKTEEESENDFH